MANPYLPPTCPAATAHGGINAQDRQQVVLVVAPYAGASVGDFIEAFWTGAPVGSATLDSTAALARSLSFGAIPRRPGRCVSSCVPTTWILRSSLFFLPVRTRTSLTSWRTRAIASRSTPGKSVLGRWSMPMAICSACSLSPDNELSSRRYSINTGLPA